MARYGKTLKEQLGVSDDAEDKDKGDDQFERIPHGHWPHGEPHVKLSSGEAYVFLAVLLAIAIGLFVTGSWIASIVTFVFIACLVFEGRPGGFFYEKKDE